MFFSASIEIIIGFIFQFVNVVYYIDWFVDIKESLDGIKENSVEIP